MPSERALSLPRRTSAGDAVQADRQLALRCRCGVGGRPTNTGPNKRPNSIATRRASGFACGPVCIASSGPGSRIGADEPKAGSWLRLPLPAVVRPGTRTSGGAGESDGGQDLHG